MQSQAVRPLATAQLDRDVASVLNLTNGVQESRPSDISRVGGPGKGCVGVGFGG